MDVAVLRMEFKSFVKLQLTHSYSFLKYLKWIKNEEDIGFESRGGSNVLMTSSVSSCAFVSVELQLAHPCYENLLKRTRNEEDIGSV